MYITAFGLIWFFASLAAALVFWAATRVGALSEILPEDDVQ